ncbi:response regulator [Paenibacillus contaminans]|nr:response regulator [Paenibacillus contaminans]
MKAVIVDDEIPSQDILKYILEKDGRLQVAGTYASPHAALRALPVIRPDVVFIDVQMPMMSGLEMASKVNGINEHIHIVFVTGHQTYALQAFELGVLDYVLKPVTPIQLNRAIERLLKRKSQQPVEHGAHSAESKTPSSPPLSAPSSARIRCLGGFEVTGPGAEAQPIKWRTSKTEELMAYLYLKRSKRVTKWELFDNIWPNVSQEQAHSHLHTTLYKVRRSLKEADIAGTIDYANNCYEVHLASILSDAESFERFVHNEAPVNGNNAEQYERMLASHQGELFEGYDYVWCESAREYYRDLYVKASRQLALHWIEQGSYEPAIAVLRRSLDKFYLDEDSHELMLRTYFLRKDRISLVKHYQSFHAMLQTELGLLPKESTSQMYADMLESL